MPRRTASTDEHQRVSSIHRIEFEVQEDEIDELNHVGNLQYLRWTNRAAVRHSAHLGWDTQRYREFGMGFVVRSHEIQYRAPALLGDSIMIETWIASMERASCLRKYRILRRQDERLLARAETTWAFVRFSDMRLQRIPEQIVEAFAQ